MRGGLLVVLCCVFAVRANLDLGTPIPGTLGSGFSFGISDGKGHAIVATAPAAHQATHIQKLNANGTVLAEVSLGENKGHATCGCLLDIDGVTYLYAGLSVGGFAVRVNLNFPSNNSLKYLEATNSDLLWGGDVAQTFVSAVCKGKFVYFGTKSSAVFTTVLRVDTTTDDPAKKFKTLGPIGPGDLALAAEWEQDDILFAMEPQTGGSPTFFKVKAGDDFKLQDTITVSPALSHFDQLTNMRADPTTRRIILANGSGKPHIVVLDLSRSSVASVEQELSLESIGLSPLTSFAVDVHARVAYATVGDCSDDDVATASLALVSIKLAPQLTLGPVHTVQSSIVGCAEYGVAAFSVLLAANTHRSLLVFTQHQTVTPHHGGILPFSVFGAGPCLNNCHEQDNHGVCVGESCVCRAAWTGPSCDVAAPCGGTNCSGHGLCNVDGNCECDVGFSSDDCSISVECPLQCSSHGVCVKGGCVCEAGFSGLGCEFESVGCESLNNCSGHGVCSPAYPKGICLCSSGFTGYDCSELAVLCAANCSGKGYCRMGVCSCIPGWTGVDCSVVDTMCANNCSGHGVCNLGICVCNVGFKGIDCGVVDRTHCPNGCNGHGSCVQGKCVCSPGWRGQDCASKNREARLASQAVLVAGENRATTSFVFTIGGRTEVAFCLATRPGKCVVFDHASMTRIREASFGVAQPRAATSLLQVAKKQGALVPDLAKLSAISLVEVGAIDATTPISVSIVEDGANGFAILGTAVQTGTAHGQLIKISLSTMETLAVIEFEDDSGRGVTAGCRGPNGTYIFVSGNSPALIYQVSASLEIITRVSNEQAPSEEVTAVGYDGNGHIIAGVDSSVYLYTVGTSGIEALATSSSVQLPSAIGYVTTGFADPANHAVYFGTSGYPGALVKVSVNQGSADVQSMRLNYNENRILSSTFLDDYAYLGLANSFDDQTCTVVVVMLSTLRQVDTVKIANCTADLISASISPDGSYAHFGTSGSPAHVYNVRLFSRDSCPYNCSGHGQCVQGTCTCSSGWMGDSCSTQVPQCPNECSHAGTCNNGVCECIENHYGADCSNVSVCTDLCQHGRCTGQGNTWPCTCESAAWEGQYCSERSSYCPNQCSSHGQCDNGVCRCHVGFGGNDCSVEQFPPVTLRSCIKDADCGTHGVCLIASGSGTGKCECATGWSGQDCDEDEDLRKDMEPSSLSTPVLVGIVIAAVAIGLVVGVAIWNSWASGQTGADAKGNAPSRVVTAQPDQQNFARLPRRLVK